MSYDIYDEYPREMRAYLKNYGWNFNKKACDYAVSLMRKRNATTNKLERITPSLKEDIDQKMKANGIVLERNIGHNYVYVYNMAMADFFKSSLPDEASVCKYVKDVIDDTDAPEGMVFRRWYADMVGGMGIVDWEEIL